jgi:exopolysaccharide production protein ExoZ
MTSRTITRLSSLDMVRGIAVIGVVAVHCGESFPSGIPFVQSLSIAGSYGVQLFFLASAFTMAYMWDVRSNNEPAPIRRFLIRRFFRIAPMFYLSAALYLQYFGESPRYWAPEGLTSWDIASTFLFLHGFWPTSISSVVPGGWSIAVEMSFYVLFPLIYIYFARDTRRLAATFLFFCLAGLFLRIFLTQILAELFVSTPYLVHNYFHYWLPNQLPVFLIGILVYRISHHPEEFGYANKVIWIFLLAIFVAISGKVAIASVGLALFLWFAVNRLPQGKFSDGGGAPLIKLGQRSYSVYLVHFIVIEVIRQFIELRGLIGFLIGFGLVIIISTGIASVCKTLIEDRFIRFGSKFAASIGASKVLQAS